MDYKYIEELLERYWQCATSLEEEEALRSFFAGKDIPAHLRPYQDLFIYQLTQKEEHISDNFEERICAKIAVPVVKARRISFVSRLTPLLKAVAMVAIVITLGGVLQRSFFGNEALDYNYESYTDTYDDPEVAYKKVSSALMMLSEGMNKSKDQYVADSLRVTIDAERINE